MEMIMRLEDSCAKYKEQVKKLINDIINVIETYGVEQGGFKVIAFNDETGYPYFNDDSDWFNSSITGIRVNNGEFEFNDDSALNEDTWFNPDDFGNYNLDNVAECILNVVKNNL